MTREGQDQQNNYSLERKESQHMGMNRYAVTAEFTKSRYYCLTEHWEGEARNMVVAVRRAAKIIMRRKSVMRLRHKAITFRIEKIAK